MQFTAYLIFMLGTVSAYRHSWHDGENYVRQKDIKIACDGKKKAILPDVKYCHQYIDCSDQHGYKVCPYPKLFSIASRSCEHFKTVKCGGRKEVKSYCRYQKPPRTSHRIPCNIFNPNCIGYPDGVNTHEGRGGNGSPWYMVCDQERLVGSGSCLKKSKSTAVIKWCDQNFMRVCSRYRDERLSERILGCREYVWCYHGRKFYYRCPRGTVFDEKSTSCEHTYDVCKPCGTKSC